MTADVRWLASREDDGEVWFRIGRAGDLLVAEWVNLCTLTASADGASFSIVAVDGADPMEVDKVRFGAAHALVQRLRGKLALHAGAVSFDDRAILLLGRNAAGKSTAVADMCSRGAVFLADDIAVVQEVEGRFLVEPSERHHWLFADSRSAVGFDAHQGVKSAADARRLSDVPVPLAALVALRFAHGEARLARLSGLNLISELVPSLVRFAIDDDAAQRQDVDALLRFAARVPSYELYRRSDLRVLREGGKLIERLLGDAVR